VDFTPTLDQLSIIRRLAALQSPGWHSAGNVVFEVGGYSQADRAAVNRVLSDLHRARLITRMFVQHRDKPMAAFLLEPDRLEDLLAEYEQ
jgi:hypothetical protein